MEQEQEPAVGIGSTAEHPAADVYDLAAIRSLVASAFMPGELPRFCQDHDFLRPVRAYFHPNDSLDEMVSLIMDYCESRLLFSELLAAIGCANPRRFERYRSQLCRQGGL